MRRAAFNERHFGISQTEGTDTFTSMSSDYTEITLFSRLSCLFDTGSLLYDTGMYRITYMLLEICNEKKVTICVFRRDLNKDGRVVYCLLTTRY